MRSSVETLLASRRILLPVPRVLAAIIAGERTRPGLRGPPRRRRCTQENLRTTPSRPLNAVLKNFLSVRSSRLKLLRLSLKNNTLPSRRASMKLAGGGFTVKLSLRLKRRPNRRIICRKKQISKSSSSTTKMKADLGMDLSKPVDKSNLFPVCVTKSRVYPNKVKPCSGPEYTQVCTIRGCQSCSGNYGTTTPPDFAWEYVMRSRKGGGIFNPLVFQIPDERIHEAVPHVSTRSFKRMLVASMTCFYMPKWTSKYPKQLWTRSSSIPAKPGWRWLSKAPLGRHGWNALSRAIFRSELRAQTIWGLSPGHMLSLLKAGKCHWAAKMLCSHPCFKANVLPPKLEESEDYESSYSEDVEEDWYDQYSQDRLSLLNDLYASMGGIPSR